MSSSLNVNTVLVGDVLEHLGQFPHDSVDIVVTSPPYNKSRDSHGWLVKHAGYNGFEDRMPEQEYQTWQTTVLKELLRIIKPGGSVFYNHKIRWMNGQLFHPLSWIILSGWTIRQEIVWDRGIAAKLIMKKVSML